MFMIIKKYFTSSLLLGALFLGQVALAETEETSAFVDDSIKDMSIVLGVGAGGAILGLSTLSFVEEPSKHLKNITVGGAIGIVIGVGIVMFSQATRSSSVIGSQAQIPMNSDQFVTQTRQEFTQVKISENKSGDKNQGFYFNFSY
jgi:hypothetical protein